MEDEQLRALIRAKTADGSLPGIALRHVWGGPGQGKPCVACDDLIRKDQQEIGGEHNTLVVAPFHVRCFHLWDSERRGGGPVLRLPTSDGDTQG